MNERPSWFKGVHEGGVRPPAEVFAELPALEEESADLVGASRQLCDYAERLHTSLGRVALVEPDSVKQLAREYYLQQSLGELYTELHESLTALRDLHSIASQQQYELEAANSVFTQKALMEMILIRSSEATFGYMEPDEPLFRGE